METRLRKSLCLMVALILTISCFAGCGKNAKDKDEQGRTILSVGNWPSKEGKQLDDINEKKARFEEANPDVVIEPDMWAFDRKTFYAKAAGNQLPTLYTAGFTEVPEIINSGYSADLTDVLSERGYDGKINPAVLKAVSDENGRVFAFPTSCYLLGLAYNTELFSKAGLMEEDGTPKQPKDWNEVVEFAVKIKEATGKPGIVFNTSNNAGGWIFTCIAWSFGVDFMEKDENGKWKATFNTPEAAEALQWYKDLKWKYDVIPSNTIVDIVEAQKTLGTGNAAMYITAGNISPTLAKYGMNPEHLGMMAMPAGPKRHVTLLGGGVSCVKAGATEDQIDAALRWLETTYTFNLTEEFKANRIQDAENGLAAGNLIGINSLSAWSDQTEAYQWNKWMLSEYANSNPNHVRLYNEFVENCPAEIQPEEPVCCQELYQILDGCIQEVLTNENADCAKLLEKAAADFQMNYLDNLIY